ncbi:MAG: hypothetical protein MJZ33_05930 [Paludibacteraceae bacterium]|nr:hypothetical protein [Paludibacteraceae bacterium]
MDKHIDKGAVWSEREHDIPHLIGVFILGVPRNELTDVITQTAECNLATGKIIWDRMRKYFISLPNFNFDEKENPSDEEIWIQTIKNIGNMVSFDPKLYDRADDELKALIDKARISALSDEGTAERHGYDRGLKEGVEIGIIQTAKNMKEEGFDSETIAKITNLTISEIEAL